MLCVCVCVCNVDVCVDVLRKLSRCSELVKRSVQMLSLARCCRAVQSSPAGGPSPAHGPNTAEPAGTQTDGAVELKSEERMNSHSDGATDTRQPRHANASNSKCFQLDLSDLFPSAERPPTSTNSTALSVRHVIDAVAELGHVINAHLPPGDVISSSSTSSLSLIGGCQRRMLPVVPAWGRPAAVGVRCQSARAPADSASLSRHISMMCFPRQELRDNNSSNV